MPQPSRMMSITGPAMYFALCRRTRTWTSSSLFLSNFRTFAAVEDRRYKKEHEVAQPVAGADLSPRLRGSRRHLFSTLGHSKALRHHRVCRRATFARQAGAYSHLLRRRRHTV